MFDFEKLEVYQVAKNLNTDVLRFLFSHTGLDPYIKDQWKRCSIGTVLNLAEGTGRISDADKKHFFTMARGSVFECVSLLQMTRELNLMDEALYNKLYGKYEQLSKMLLGMYRSKSQ